MTIAVQQLIQSGVGPTQAKLFADPLNAACALYAIDTPQRIAAFLAQAMCESLNFIHLEECLSYRDPARLVSIFRTAFDLNHNKVVDQNEIEFAKGYVHQPEKLANIVYANRYGNGPPETGDGWLYRGRGLIGLTFSDNYLAAEVGTGRPYHSHPELLALPPDACLAAAWYWQTHRCNVLADAGKFDEITREINPGMAGAKERRDLHEDTSRVFCSG